MTTKSLKLSPDLHQRLKIASAELGISLQEYHELVLNLVLSQSPVMQHLRDEYLKKVL